MKTKATKVENDIQGHDAYIEGLEKTMKTWMDLLMSKYIRQEDNFQLDGQHVHIHAGVPDDGLGHVLAGGLLVAVVHVLQS